MPKEQDKECRHKLTQLPKVIRFLRKVKETMLTKDDNPFKKWYQNNWIETLAHSVQKSALDKSTYIKTFGTTRRKIELLKDINIGENQSIGIQKPIKQGTGQMGLHQVKRFEQKRKKKIYPHTLEN